MSDSQILRVEPTPPVRATPPVRPSGHEQASVQSRQAPAQHTASAAVTDGSLRAAYAQFIVNPDTHVTVILVRDAATGQVLRETPPPEVQQMTETLKKYAEAQQHFKATRHAEAER